MPILTPAQAAAIATGVYALQSRAVSTLASEGTPLGIEGLFATGDADQLRGVSGALTRTEITGFGYIAQGVGTFRGQALVALRGTDSLADGLTDATIGAATGPTGSAVHSGFNTTWNSFAPSVQTFFRSHRPPVIHCVGHSLGGALATLAADYLSANTGALVELYTFGSPRVGGLAFARELSRRLTSDRIHRVYHPADPVAMVPLFPFLHLPFSGHGVSLPCDTTARISPDAHRMISSYLPGVANMSWSQLRANGTQTLSERQIKAWLARASQGQGVIALGARTQELIAIALDWILRQCATVALIGLQSLIGGGLTLMDQLAYLLQRGAEVSRQVAGYVESLIMVILRFVGRSVQSGLSLTQQFIRWVLEILTSTIRAMVGAGISLASQ